MDPNFCHNLQFDFEIDSSVIDELRATQELSDQYRQFDIADKIDPRMIDLLKKHGLEVDRAESFYIPPRGVLPIHVDGLELNNMTKINFIYGDPGSRMLWWKPCDPTQPIKFQKTPSGTCYIPLAEDEAEIIYSAEIRNAALLNVGIFHSVINSTDSPRWSISIGLQFIENKKSVPWDIAKQLLKEYLV
jgi:hypothetical protein